MKNTNRFEATKYEKYIIGSSKWNKLNKKKSKRPRKNEVEYIVDKISQKAFGKNYSELNDDDTWFVDDAYATNPAFYNPKNL